MVGGELQLLFPAAASERGRQKVEESRAAPFALLHPRPERQAGFGRQPQRVFCKDEATGAGVSHVHFL